MSVSQQPDEIWNFTDDYKPYRRLNGHYPKFVWHSVGEYVDGIAHTNAFWTMLKRGYKETNHKNSMKHLHRFIAEFECRGNLRELNSNRQIQAFTE